MYGLIEDRFLYLLLYSPIVTPHITESLENATAYILRRE